MALPIQPTQSRQALDALRHQVDDKDGIRVALKTQERTWWCHLEFGSATACDIEPRGKGIVGSVVSVAEEGICIPPIARASMTDEHVERSLDRTCIHSFVYLFLTGFFWGGRLFNEMPEMVYHRTNCMMMLLAFTHEAPAEVIHSFV